MSAMSREAQRGFIMIAAIFLLVVLAALGGFMLTVGALSNTASGLDVEGAKAYQAARAGIEWGAYQVLQNSLSCASTTSSFSPGGTLSAYTVTVAVTCAGYSEITANTASIYTVVSTACNKASGGACPGTVADNYVERQIQVTIDK